MPWPLYTFMAIQLLFVSWVDIRTQKIANYWSILNIVSFIILVALFPTIYSFNLSTFIYAFAFLGIGFLLFMLNIMGGGDSKYLFSFFLIIPPTLLEKTLTSLLVSTILIGSFVFFTNFVRNFDRIYKTLKNKDTKGLKECFGTKFSFAPVILTAWIYVGWEIRNSIF